MHPAAVQVSALCLGASLGALARPHDFEALRSAAHINDRARATLPSEDFSAAIRKGVPQAPALP